MCRRSAGMRLALTPLPVPDIHDEYEETVGAFVRAYSDNPDVQRGDPAKMAAVILRLTEEPAPPTFCTTDSPTGWKTFTVGFELENDAPIVGETPFETGLAGLEVRSDQMIDTTTSWTLPVTLQLAFMAIVISLTIGITAGVVSAVLKDSVWDYAANIFALWGRSTPNFWLGIMLIFLFSVHLGWLPASGYVRPTEDFWGSIASTIMPAFVLGNVGAAVTKFAAPFVLLAGGWQDVALIWASVLGFMAFIFWFGTEDDPVIRERLLNGWDDIALTLAHEAEITTYEQDRERELV